eukprot:SAG11_NODE_21775_length_419_cov_0.643750_1_plen_92_part_01
MAELVYAMGALPAEQLEVLRELGRRTGKKWPQYDQYPAHLRVVGDGVPVGGVGRGRTRLLRSPFFLCVGRSRLSLALVFSLYSSLPSPACPP